MTCKLTEKRGEAECLVFKDKVVLKSVKLELEYLGIKLDRNKINIYVGVWAQASYKPIT